MKKEVDGGAVWRRHAVSAALIIAMIVAACIYRPDKALRVAVGLTAHDLCSATFVSGLDPDLYFAEALARRPGYRLLAKHMQYEVNREKNRVDARFGQILRRAVFVPGRGCLLTLDGTEPSAPLRPEPASLPVLPEIAPPEVVQAKDPTVRAGLDQLFTDTDPKHPRQVKAVVVVHDGKVIAERYAEGFGVSTPINGWSVSKSVINALRGVMVRDGRLSMDAPAQIPLWRLPGDPRGQITLDQLERMDSGLSVDEDNSGFDVSSQILFTERDTVKAAVNRPLKRQPGSAFVYGSPNTLILARILENANGHTPEGFLRFARRELFEPLGMDHVTVEFDGVGTPLGSSYILAPARSWARFGWLYANDGMAGKVRILPQGWIDYSRRATHGSNYAAGFWTNSGDAPEAAGRIRGGFPKDGFYASGALGQRLYILPRQHLVIARFGYSPDEDQGIVADLAFMRVVLHALSHDTPARS